MTELLDIKEKIMIAGQGNIGSITALIHIAKTDEPFIDLLSSAILSTQSKSYAIWIAYKDICKFNVEQTKKVLQDWLDNPLDPLEIWLEEQGNE